MGGPRPLVVYQADAPGHQQRIVGAWVAVNEREPGAGIGEPRRQQLHLAGRRRLADPVDDDGDVTLDAPAGRTARTPASEDRLKCRMMRLAAPDRVGMQSGQRGHVGHQRALRVLGGSTQEGIDQRAETLAEVLEHQDAGLDISGQECTAMLATGGALGEMRGRHPFSHQARRFERIFRGWIVVRGSGCLDDDGPGPSGFVDRNGASDQISPLRLADGLNPLEPDHSARRA